VQECLTNVARHAEAKRVHISLKCQDGSLLLRVSDDGKGIPAAHEKKRDSYGVIGMRERAHGLGGTLNLSSIAGEGTTVEVVIPVEQTNFSGALP
jgi:signal transduction histidine kinase